MFKQSVVRKSDIFTCVKFKVAHIWELVDFLGNVDALHVTYRGTPAYVDFIVDGDLDSEDRYTIRDGDSIIFKSDDGNNTIVGVIDSKDSEELSKWQVISED